MAISAKQFATARNIQTDMKPRFAIIRTCGADDTIRKLRSMGARVTPVYSLLSAPVRAAGDYRGTPVVGTLDRKLVVLVSGDVSRSQVRSIPGVTKMRTNSRPTGGATYSYQD